MLGKTIEGEEKKKKSLDSLNPFPFCPIPLLPFIAKPPKKSSLHPVSNPFLLLFFEVFHLLMTTKTALIKVSNDIHNVKFNSQFSWKGFLFVWFSAIFQAARGSPDLWTVLHKRLVNE